MKVAIDLSPFEHDISICLGQEMSLRTIVKYLGLNCAATKLHTFITNNPYLKVKTEKKRIIDLFNNEIIEYVRDLVIKDYKWIN